MSLKKQVLHGTKWIAITNIFKQVLQIVSLIIFARLLSTEDFGLFAILMIFLGFLDMFVDMGTSSALIQIKNPSQKLLSSIFYFNVFIGLSLCIILYLLAGYIALFFDAEKLQILLQIISINFIIASFSVVQKALFEKNIDFKRVTLIESFAVFISIALGIIAAVYGLGVYSLVIQVLTFNIIRVLLMWIVSSWRPSFYFSLDDIKSIWKYTSNLFSFNFINYFARNADNFLIGKFLGSPALGVYSMAYRIMLYPLQNITQILIRILFPAFAKIKDDNNKFQNAYLKVIFFIALIAFPLMVGLMATSNLFVDVLLGQKWHNLANIIMILAPVGMMQSIVSTTGSIYMAKGNTNLLFKMGLLNSVVTVVFFILGLPFGVEGVAFAYLLSNLLMLYIVLMVSWRQIDLSVSEGIRKIIPILLISILMGINVKIVEYFIAPLIGSDILSLVLMIGSGVITYLILIHFKYGSIKKLLSELKK